MLCPNCQHPVHRPPPGHVWRHCENCGGWFLWDRTSMSGLILDMLETFAGRWHTQDELVSMVSDRRPGVNAESVRRSIRMIRVNGGGLAADREIVCETSGGCLQLGRRRRITVECSTDTDPKMRVVRPQ